MVTWFQGDIEGGAPGLGPGLAQGLNFGMGLAVAVVIALAHNVTIFHDHGPYHGIGGGITSLPLAASFRAKAMKRRSSAEKDGIEVD